VVCDHARRGEERDIGVQLITTFLINNHFGFAEAGLLLINLI
jgi:hypothetical protein